MPAEEIKFSRELMKKIILISSLLLVGCNRQMTDAGYHDCNDAIHEYKLNVLLGKNKGIRDSLTLKASNASLYVFPNGKFSVSYTLRGFKQITPNVPYQLNDNLMTGIDTKEEVITDPSTNKEWIRQRVTEITVNYENTQGQTKEISSVLLNRFGEQL